MPEAKKFLDYAGLQTFLNNLKYNYAQGSDGYVVGKAAALSGARSVALTGNVTGSTTWDGSGALSIATTVDSSFANVIETVKVNGTALEVTNKAVDITVPAATVTDVQTKTASDGSYATVLNGTVAKIDLSGYALKSDITAVMKFKGTKTSDELAALTGMSTGDTYSIVTGGTGTTYKVGSEYAYDGTNWVELGPVIDLSGYVEKTQKVNNKALSGDITLDGSDIALSTNYAIASTAAAPAAGDSIDTAVGKLQKEIVDANAAATTYAFAEGSTNGAFQVTPTTGGVAGSAQSVSIHGLGSAAYADTTDFVDSSLEPAEAGAQVNVIETVKVNGTALTPDADKAVDITVPSAPVQDVRVSTDGSTYTSVLSGTNADIDLSGYATTSDISDFIELTDLSVTAGTGDYVTGISYDNTTGVFTETKAAKGSIADSNTGLVDGDTVYDYFEAHKADGNVIEEIKFKGNGDAQASALTVTNKSVTVDVSGYALTTDIPSQATAVADSDTGYTTGDQVYDYIDGMAIPDATINALFPANPSSGS